MSANLLFVMTEKELDWLDKMFSELNGLKSLLVQTEDSAK